MGSGLKLDGFDSRVYVMIGDGETRRARLGGAMYGAYHKVDNVSASWIYNRFSSTLRQDILDVAPVAEKWRASAGTRWRSTATTWARCKRPSRKPRRRRGSQPGIVANTIKGKGVSFMENNPKFHGVAPTPQEVELALKELA